MDALDLPEGLGAQFSPSRSALSGATYKAPVAGGIASEVQPKDHARVARVTTA
jgi:hypothetical protein